MLILKSDKTLTDKGWGFPHILLLFLPDFIVLLLLLAFSGLTKVFAAPGLQLWVLFNTNWRKPKIQPE